jgi:hypothetical protein
MSLLALLLAQGADDWIWIVVFILFVVVPAIGKLIGKLVQQQPGGGRAGGQPRPGGAPARQPRGGGLEDEIGEFLRRAAQRGQPQPQPAARAQPQPAARPPVPRAAIEQAIEAEVVGRPALGEGIKQHVGEHLDAGEFRRRAAGLGGEVAQADEQIEQRLHARFDHEVSTLAAVPGESAHAPRPVEAAEPEDRVAEIPSTAAAGLAAMLANPGGVRQAIVLNEIFTRPEDRWA